MRFRWDLLYPYCRRVTLCVHAYEIWEIRAFIYLFHDNRAIGKALSMKFVIYIDLVSNYHREHTSRKCQCSFGDFRVYPVLYDRISNISGIWHFHAVGCVLSTLITSTLAGRTASKCFAYTQFHLFNHFLFAFYALAPCCCCCLVFIFIWIG